MNEEILSALKNLSETMNKGFSDMSTRFASIEERLTAQEEKTHRAYKRQALMENDVEALKRIVYELAAEEPCRIWPDGTAIRKEAAYRKFARRGVGKVKALCALRDAGVIRTDATGRNSLTIWLDNRPQRVIIVQGEEGRDQ